MVGCESVHVNHLRCMLPEEAKAAEATALQTEVTSITVCSIEGSRGVVATADSNHQ
jgi:hypothetical protein